mmetsp:Transcript_22499/g.59265  ORF Transcript_22499/g.59265 Transcript_22499/m.59265 type:complete len:209 (-) Transcript_22499:215-841(-)
MELNSLHLPLSTRRPPKGRSRQRTCPRLRLATRLHSTPPTVRRVLSSFGQGCVALAPTATCPFAAGVASATAVALASLAPRRKREDVRDVPEAVVGFMCVEMVNKYRAKAGRGAISSCSGSQVDLANSMAAWDSVHGPHNWVHTKGWSGVCPSGASGQCEAPRYRDQESAVQAYYKEGPSGGHYKILMQASSCVACGQSGSFYTHNFC